MSITLKSNFRRIASPHYYHGRSATKLTLQNLLQVLSFVKTPKPSKMDLLETLELKGSKEGKVGLVLGNGPSLDNLNVDAVSEHVDDIFVINAFNKLKLSMTLKPSYYGLSDPAHFGLLIGEREEERNEILNYIKENNATLILPHTASSSKVFEENKKIYFDDRELTFFNKNISPIKPRGYGSTTIYKVLAMATYLGYDKIYILGFDNTNYLNYRGRPDNLIGDAGGATAKKQFEIKSSFIENYEKEFTSGMAGRMQSYSHLFGDLQRFTGNRIYNLDAYSLTDAFPKVMNHPLVISRIPS